MTMEVCWRRGWEYRALARLLDSVSCRFYNAVRAVNAGACRGALPAIARWLC